MNLLRVTIKALISSEEQMQLEAKSGNLTPNEEKFWVWRESGIPCSEIYRILAYDASGKKCIIEMYNEQSYISNESFDSVFAKWEALKEYDIQEEEPNNTGEEHKQEEEDEEK